LSHYTSPSRFLSVPAAELFHIPDKPFIALVVLIVVPDYDPRQFVIGSSQAFLSLLRSF
jgi:hypothetical protein